VRSDFTTGGLYLHMGGQAGHLGTDLLDDGLVAAFVTHVG